MTPAQRIKQAALYTPRGRYYLSSYLKSDSDRRAAELMLDRESRFWFADDAARRIFLLLVAASLEAKE